MEIKGTIDKSLPTESGQGKNGEWKKKPVIIQTEGKYPKSVCIEFWNDQISLLQGLQKGSPVAITVELSSREANGRWYTSAKATGLSRIEKASQQSYDPRSRRVEAEPSPTYADDSTDLPF